MTQTPTPTILTDEQLLWIHAACEVEVPDEAWLECGSLNDFVKELLATIDYWRTRAEEAERKWRPIAEAPKDGVAVPPFKFAQLYPYNGKTNSWGQAAALRSAAKFLLARYETARCDSEAVSCCVRCASVYAASSILSLVDQANALPTPPSTAQAKE